MGAEADLIQLVKGRQQIRDLIHPLDRIGHNRIDLRPVAGGKDDRLFDVRIICRPGKRLFLHLWREGQLLPELDGGRLMAEPHYHYVHSATFSLAASRRPARKSSSTSESRNRSYAWSLRSWSGYFPLILTRKSPSKVRYCSYSRPITWASSSLSRRA